MYILLSQDFLCDVHYIPRTDLVLGLIIVCTDQLKYVIYLKIFSIIKMLLVTLSHVQHDFP
jgi:hypothetical protein